MIYSTYILGTDAIVQSNNIADVYSAFAAAYRRATYKSNWRILHIDGLEGAWAIDPPGGYQKTRLKTKIAALADPYGRKQ